MNSLKKKKIKKDLKSLWRDRELIVMTLPAVILLAMFKIAPWSGLQLAFKRFNYAEGIFGSPWVGLNNFKFLFLSGDAFTRLTRNTVGYYLLFTVVGTICSSRMLQLLSSLMHF